MKTGYIKKLIKLAIIVIIPLIAGVITGVYAYNRYQYKFFDHYMSEASTENTEERLVTYLDFINENIEYTKEESGFKFFYNQDFSNENGNLFTLSIIRSYEMKEDVPYTNKLGTVIGERDEYYVTYYLALYNVNYENVAKTLDPTGEHPLLYTELPTFTFTITDKEDDELTRTEEFTTVAQITGETNFTVIYDYGYQPEKDSKNNKLNAGNPTSMKYYVLTGAQLDGYSENVEFSVSAKSAWKVDDNQVTEELSSVDFNNLYNNKYLLDIEENAELEAEFKKFNKGYNRDIFEAGYAKYVFGHYIWWEALIAIALLEFVCASFVLVWNAEEEKERKRSENKKQK